MEDQPQVLSVERVGQLTGSTRKPEWPLTRDCMGWPLLNETGRWGSVGVDLGATTEHRGRLYIFFGDVAIEQDPSMHGFSGNPFNSDAVCWTGDSEIVRHGGHLANGWNFHLPNDHQGATVTTGQPDWRFCRRCHGLFRAPGGDPVGSICPAGGQHHPVGRNFHLPNDHQGATVTTGQPDWRFCRRCHGLFRAPGGDPVGSICPAGGQHHPVGRNFHLPNDHQGASVTTGQPDWRFCETCRGLFWNGSDSKGLCLGAAGGGFRLHPVVDHRGFFDPFRVDGPIGILGSNETPVGAFSYGDRVFVFAWVGPRPAGTPQPGSYLLSKADPGTPGPYHEEQLFSPLTFDSSAFWQVSPWVVDNADHQGLPAADGDGLVMFGHGFNAKLGQDAVHLAWMPLDPDSQPPAGTRYYTANLQGSPWSTEQRAAVALFPRNGYTALSSAWLEGPRRWILLYSKAHPIERADGPIVARIGPTPWTWSEEVEVFNPRREDAYTRYMHWPGLDRLHPDLPPPQPPGLDQPGWAYGAFLLHRFTEWDPGAGILGIYFLLSTGSPYQVQVMHTRLRVR